MRGSFEQRFVRNTDPVFCLDATFVGLNLLPQNGKPPPIDLRRTRNNDQIARLWLKFLRKVYRPSDVKLAVDASNILRSIGVARYVRRSAAKNDWSIWCD